MPVSPSVQHRPAVPVPRGHGAVAWSSAGVGLPCPADLRSCPCSAPPNPVLSGAAQGLPSGNPQAFFLQRSLRHLPGGASPQTTSSTTPTALLFTPRPRPRARSLRTSQAPGAGTLDALLRGGRLGAAPARGSPVPPPGRHLALIRASCTLSPAGGRRTQLGPSAESQHPGPLGCRPRILEPLGGGAEPLGPE